MPVVVNVRFRYSNSDWLAEISDPELEIHRADHVLVETEKGKDVALVISEPESIEKEELSEEEELGLVKRIACDNDFEHVQDLVNRGKEAMGTFREYIQKNELEMNPIAIHFLFDGSRGIFYFTAKERVDFRVLVHDLAGYFHMRIDMRQVGIRDEARMLGGFGMCGEELCCARMAGKLEPVSIRMAKVQDLSLNPTKISGLCGRLMCCLNYELEAYNDFKSRAPQKNDLIETPLGTGKVVDYNTPLETITLRMEDGSQLVVPLKEMDCAGKANGEHQRPCHVSQEALDRINEELHKDKTLAMMGKRLFSTSPELADREASASAAKGSSLSANRGAQGGSVGQGTGAGQSGSMGQKNARSSASNTVDLSGTNFDDAAASNNAKGFSDEAGSSKNAGKKRKNTRNQRNRAGFDNGRDYQDSDDYRDNYSQSKNRRTDKSRRKRSYNEDQEDFQDSSRKSRFTKRRHRVLSDSDDAHNNTYESANENRNEGAAASSRVRPGQHSSGISGDDFNIGGNGFNEGSHQNKNSRNRKDARENSRKENGEHPAYNRQNEKGRKPRRRRHLS